MQTGLRFTFSYASASYELYGNKVYIVYRYSSCIEKETSYGVNKRWGDTARSNAETNWWK